MPQLPIFISEGRAAWHQLDDLIALIESQGGVGLTRKQLSDSSHLYRLAIRDLAFAKAHFPETTLVPFLQNLVGRAHYQIFRPQAVTWVQVLHFFRRDVPQAARFHFHAITWAAIIFFLGLVFGWAVVHLDEDVANLVLPTWIIDDIHGHRMWTGYLFSALPGPVASTAIFTNNLSVAFMAFAGGLTFGVITTWVLFLNGFTLGVVINLCTANGLLYALGEFVAGHGCIEISSMIVSGGAGLVVANALFNPGQLTRADALYIQGQSALRMVVGITPVLVGAGCIEAFISPANIPAIFKIVLGLVLGTMFWGYLLVGKLPNLSDARLSRGGS